MRHHCSLVVTDRLDDLEVYKLLLAEVEALEALALRCHSPAAATGLRATSVLVRTVASGIYRATLRPVDDVTERAASV